MPERNDRELLDRCRHEQADAMIIHAQNRQAMWKYRRWHRSGVTRPLPGTLLAPVWIIRRRGDGHGYVVRRIGLQRFLEYARRDRATIAICKREEAARAYRERLQMEHRAWSAEVSSGRGTRRCIGNRPGMAVTAQCG